VTEGKAGLTGLLNLLTFKYAEEQMKRFPIAIVSIIVLLVAGAATVSFASTSWSGTASGSCAGYNPWVNWVGTLTPNSVGYDFIGYWGGNTANHIYGDVDSTISLCDYTRGIWFLNGSQAGHWSGIFNERTGNASGYWWGDADSSSCNGAWWGTKQ
jgi:hypothetical protein